MSSLLWPLFVLILLSAAVVAALWGYRAYTTGDTTMQPALAVSGAAGAAAGVMEQASVDSRRKLVLIRRDDVEHLIMTGGPVDVVIETGIPAGRLPDLAPEAALPPSRRRREPPPPVFSRTPRGFGQAVNE